MQEQTIENRLESAASYGEMEINLFLWKKKISRLRKNGLTVTEKFESKRKGEFYCNVSWKDATDAQNGKSNQANRLYEMAVNAKKEK